MCVKCYFDNKQDFDKVREYLEGIGQTDLCISGRDIEWDEHGLYIESYNPITQDQLNELTALCPIRPKIKVSEAAVYQKIAYLIGVVGPGYHPEDDIKELAPEGSSYEDLVHLELIQNDIDYMCDKLGLDPCAIALRVMSDLGIIPDHLK